MKKILFFLLFVISFVFAHDECITVKHVTTDNGFDDNIIILAFNKAKSDNKPCVKLTGGNWKIKNFIVVPTGMELRGTYTAQHGYTKAGSTVECFGEQLVPDQFNGKQGCIMLQGGSAVDGLNVVWPYGRYADASWSPFNPYVFNGIEHNYPWSISCISSSTLDGLDYPGKCTIRNVTISNAKFGIDLDFGFDHHLENVNIGTYGYGILLDNIASLGIMENIRISDEYIWEYYNKSSLNYNKAEIPGYVNEGLYNWVIGIKLNRVDWGDLRNIYVRKAYKGFVFDINPGVTYEIPFPQNPPNMWWQNPQVYFNTIVCDSCNYAIDALSIQKPAGIQIVNGNLMGKINVEYSNWGPIHISNTILDYATPTLNENLPHIYNKSSNCEISLSNTIIRTGGNASTGASFNHVIIQNYGRMSLSNVNMIQLNPSIPYSAVFQHVITADADKYHKSSFLWWDGLYSTANLVYSQIDHNGSPVTGRLLIQNVNHE